MSEYQEKGDLSHFIGCLLAGVIRSKLISVQFDHPVVTLLYAIKHQSVNITYNMLTFSATVYQNVWISGEKDGISHFIG